MSRDYVGYPSQYRELECSHCGIVREIEVYDCFDQDEDGGSGWLVAVGEDGEPDNWRECPHCLRTDESIILGTDIDDPWESVEIPPMMIHHLERAS